MSQIFLGQLSPGEIQIRERDCHNQKMWGGGISLAEKLGFVMSFKPGDMVMLLDSYNTASGVRAEVEGAMDWGAYQVKILEGPRAGESVVINWAAVTPIGPGFTEDKALPKKQPVWSLADALRRNRTPETTKPLVEGVIRVKANELADVNEQRRLDGLVILERAHGASCGCKACAAKKGK